MWREKGRVKGSVGQFLRQGLAHLLKADDGSAQWVAASRIDSSLIFHGGASEEATARQERLVAFCTCGVHRRSR
jgi:hypothetical protein